ncbi:MAG TPA: hypothetical protein VFZ35_02450, partial [Sphingomicrobium sp.]
MAGGNWRLKGLLSAVPPAFALMQAGPADAQRANENAVTAADDAFGTSIGNENVGIYNPDEVRGFSPVAAGNLRLEGLYLGNVTLNNPRLPAGSLIRVGLSAQGYPFPAPTGIVDYSLKPAGSEPSLSTILHAGVQTAVEVDAQIPLGPTLSIAASASASRFRDAPGGDIADYHMVAVAPAWRPRSGIVIRPYFGINYSPRDVSTPFTFVSGPHMPPEIPHDTLGQEWAAWENLFTTYGVVGHATLGAWRIAAGFINRDLDYRKSFNTL